MSSKQASAFWEAVKADPILRDRINRSVEGEIDTPIELDAVIAIAREAGFILTAYDLLDVDPLIMLQLSDEDLEKVSPN